MIKHHTSSWGNYEYHCNFKYHAYSSQISINKNPITSLSESVDDFRNAGKMKSDRTSLKCSFSRNLSMISVNCVIRTERTKVSEIRRNLTKSITNKIIFLKEQCKDRRQTQTKNMMRKSTNFSFWKIKLMLWSTSLKCSENTGIDGPGSSANTCSVWSTLHRSSPLSSANDNASARQETAKCLKAFKRPQELISTWSHQLI